MVGYYSEEELKQIGLKSFGDNVLISKKTSIYTPELITIGNNVRIDDYCFLVGNIDIGNYIHIAPYASIHGTGGGSVTMHDYSGLGSYSVIYASGDDFSGTYIANSMVDLKFRRIVSCSVVLEKFALATIKCVLLPGAYMAEGTVLGSMSVLSRKTEPWWIYSGNPCKKLIKRKEKSIELEKEFQDSILK